MDLLMVTQENFMSKYSDHMKLWIIRYNLSNSYIVIKNIHIFLEEENLCLKVCTYLYNSTT